MFVAQQIAQQRKPCSDEKFHLCGFFQVLRAEVLNSSNVLAFVF